MADAQTNTIVMNINNRQYSQFKEVSITQSLDSIAGSFEAVIANEVISKLSVKMFDTVEILVNGFGVLYGYINNTNPSYSTSSHDVNISGFDQTIDVVECSINTTVTYNGPITLIDLISKILDDSKINSNILVSYQKGIEKISYNKDEIVAAESGESIFDYIDRIARKKQCLLSHNNKGNIVIYRIAGLDIGAEIRNEAGKNNNDFILSAGATYDYSRRFRGIVVISQTQKGNDIMGWARDNGARDNRIKAIISDSAVDLETAQKIATWEVNKRRSDSVQYSCRLQGFWATKDKIWQPNQLVNIYDDFADINGKMLLRDVTYNLSDNEGSTVDLTFVSPDSYSLQLTDPNAKYNKTGDNIKR
jgi:prophage tail gpP-like protein